MITITNLNKKFGVNERFLRTILRDVTRRLKLKTKELEIIFLDSKSIEELNRRFRKIDRPTDVLVFNLDGSEARPKFSVANIFISLDQASKNSRLFSSSFEKEIILCIIHGILHLVGYDDKKSSDRTRMAKREETLLNQVCGPRDLSRVLTRP